ncbi:unnamed protein product [Rangifer tarandus platyrhynchus]|uniref:Uncharacterized protein n=1 Tax=Rangifer tarandus platyrhynchus TaxID=3082113 RepID=A0ABN8Z3N9_RANTA|nr:unnamed protein product [Rangifer tarandus platyrhynchus]
MRNPVGHDPPPKCRDAPGPRSVLRGLLPNQRARSLRRHAAPFADQQRRRVAERPHCAPAWPEWLRASEPDPGPGLRCPRTQSPPRSDAWRKHSGLEGCFSLEQILGGGSGGGGGWGLFRGSLLTGPPPPRIRIPAVAGLTCAEGREESGRHFLQVQRHRRF